MNKPTLITRLKYKFDNLMSAGPIALIGALGLISLVLILAAGLILAITEFAQEGSEPVGFIEAVWESLMRTLDPGTMGQDTGWGYRIIMLMVTLGGIFIVSTFIGIIANGISNKLDELRKGHSFVVEKNHTLILGWSEKIFPIISELVIANENLKKPCIVVLAKKDKVEMEDEIQTRIPDTKNTKVICRNGNPIDQGDLGIVNLNEARSIIILSESESDPDVHVIKTILAITNNHNRKKENYHIVAELSDAKNKYVAEMIGNNELTVIHTDELISRVIAQTCRQSGLSVVYTELLDFGGDEIYFHSEPALTGKTFKESVLMYNNSAVIGISKQDGSIKINPPMDTVFETGDKVIAISEDDDTVKLSGLFLPDIAESAIVNETDSLIPVEHTLLIGWNERAPKIICELDSYLAAGSTLTVLAETDEIKSQLDEIQKEIKNQNLSFIKGNTTHRQTLEKLDFISINHIIILCYSQTGDAQEADSRTLITLLHLRDISEKLGKHFSIVSEMLDIRNKELAEVTKADDFIISNKLVSLMLTQLSENRQLKAVFDDLFDPEGSEIYLKPIKYYVKPGAKLDFYTVSESAARKNETAIGYRICAHAHNAEKAYGVVINPDKSEKIVFNENDKVIVIAED
jgi:voltage-gated potassium channel Kch